MAEDHQFKQGMLQLSSIPDQSIFHGHKELLEELLRQGNLKEENLTGKVLDLGCGRGISTLALRYFTSEIYAVDVNPNDLKSKILTTILPHERAVCEDARQYLKRTREDYDLIAFFGLTIPCSLRELYELCNAKLKTDGKVLFHSLQRAKEVKALQKELGGLVIASGEEADRAYVLVKKRD